MRTTSSRRACLGTASQSMPSRSIGRELLMKRRNSRGSLMTATDGLGRRRYRSPSFQLRQLRSKEGRCRNFPAVIEADQIRLPSGGRTRGHVVDEVVHAVNGRLAILPFAAKEL